MLYRRQQLLSGHLTNYRTELLHFLPEERQLSCLWQQTVKAIEESTGFFSSETAFLNCVLAMSDQTHWQAE